MRERGIYPQDCLRTVRSRRNRFGNTELACSPKYHGAKTAYWAVGRQLLPWDYFRIARQPSTWARDPHSYTMVRVDNVAEVSDGTLVGFLEVDLRSHADGCNPSQAVGYIEGWYVAEDYRHRGVGKKLLAKAEDWARSHRCLEMASDAIIDNELSQRAHEALGYEVVDRCVHYRKRL